MQLFYSSDNPDIRWKWQKAVIYIALFFGFWGFYLLSVGYSEASGAFSYSSDDTVIGFKQIHTIKDDDTLLDLARQYDIGYNSIIAANPGIDPWIPKKDTKILIPTMWVLPDASHDGVVINLAEMRLYYFFKVPQTQSNFMVRTFPIGVGTEGFVTPYGSYHVADKEKNPTWHVPESIRKEKPFLPLSVPPGHDNPLGKFILHLSLPGYGIHGTNKPLGVGRRVSHGCIRLYPEDIARLFPMVPVGTKVTVTYEPVKIGVRDGDIYIEVHDDYLKQAGNLYNYAVKKLIKLGLLKDVDLDSLRKAIKDKSGVPTPISKKYPDENLAGGRHLPPAEQLN